VAPTTSLSFSQTPSSPKVQCRPLQRGVSRSQAKPQPATRTPSTWCGMGHGPAARTTQSPPSSRLSPRDPWMLIRPALGSSPSAAPRSTTAPKQQVTKYQYHITNGTARESGVNTQQRLHRAPSPRSSITQTRSLTRTRKAFPSPPANQPTRFIHRVLSITPIQ
jgi:hypothetical protein